MTYTDQTTGDVVAYRMKHDRSRCLYCLRVLVRGGCGPDGRTRDHVPPDCVFLRGAKPPNLITVPSCRACNFETHRDDEIFRIYVIGEAYPHPTAQRLWDEDVVKGTFRRSPRLRRALADSIRTYQVRTEAGIYLGDAEALSLDRERINRVLRKMVVGLMWFHYDLMPGMEQLSFAFADREPPGGALVLQRSNLVSVGGDAFQYRHGIDANDPRWSVWVFRFYGKTRVWVMTKAAGAGDEEQPPWSGALPWRPESPGGLTQVGRDPGCAES